MFCVWFHHSIKFSGLKNKNAWFCKSSIFLKYFISSIGNVVFVLTSLNLLEWSFRNFHINVYFAVRKLTSMGRAFEYRGAAKEKRWANIQNFFKSKPHHYIGTKKGGPDPEMNSKLRPQYSIWPKAKQYAQRQHRSCYQKGWRQRRCWLCGGELWGQRDPMVCLCLWNVLQTILLGR